MGPFRKRTNRIGNAFFQLALVGTVFWPATSGFPVEPTNSRLVIHLLDYLARDYAGAVQRGKVINQAEYDEQVEFVSLIERDSRQYAALDAQGQITNSIRRLGTLVTTRADADAVSALARQIQGDLIKKARIKISPTTWPDLGKGQKLYEGNCAPCHGEEGRGDGPAAKTLNPKPANFLAAERGKSSFPFQSYNVVRLGVPGTGMVPFTKFSDEEVWSLSFYVNSLRWSSVQREVPVHTSIADATTLTRVASESDEKLLEELSKERDPRGALAYLRTVRASELKQDSLALAVALLNAAMDDYKSGNGASAKSEALRAYLEGVEPVENRIRASDPELVVAIEDRMVAVRTGIDKEISAEALKWEVNAAVSEIEKARELTRDKPLSPTLNFFAAFFILIREGFEAVLIILTLLGVTRAASSRAAENWIHGGWAAALGVAVLTWFLSGWALELGGAQREIMEGIISLFAVIVLLYVGFWLHRQTEIKRWTQFLNEKVRRALEGNKLIGLGLISFTAVFREAFETVLFARALWLETGDAGKISILMGIASALVVIFALSWLALRASRKLPLRTFFTLSSAVMAVLAGVLAGKGVHALQEAGLVSVTRAPLNVRLELVGVYPTFETVLPQFVVVAVICIVFYVARRPKSTLSESEA